MPIQLRVAEVCEMFHLKYLSHMCISSHHFSNINYPCHVTIYTLDNVFNAIWSPRGLAWYAANYVKVVLGHKRRHMNSSTKVKIWPEYFVPILWNWQTSARSRGMWGTSFFDKLSCDVSVAGNRMELMYEIQFYKLFLIIYYIDTCWKVRSSVVCYAWLE